MLPYSPDHIHPAPWGPHYTLTTREKHREKRGGRIQEKVQDKSRLDPRVSRSSRGQTFISVCRVTSYFLCCDCSKYSCCANPRGAFSNNRIQQATLTSLSLIRQQCYQKRKHCLLLEIKPLISVIKSSQLLIKQLSREVETISTRRRRPTDGNFDRKWLKGAEKHLLRPLTANQG